MPEPADPVAIIGRLGEFLAVSLLTGGEGVHVLAWVQQADRPSVATVAGEPTS